MSGIEVTLSASASTAAPGETVQLTVSAHNSTNGRVQIGKPCGPAMDIVVIAPMGSSVSLLNELLGPSGAFTCELAEHHFVDPGETEVVRLDWRAPQRRGEYRAVGGIRGGYDELHTLSAPVVISVH
jgi:hypothetical protein